MPSQNPSLADTMRPFNAALDIPLLAQLATDAESTDQTGDVQTEAMLRERLDLMRNTHNPATDMWVVEDPNNSQRLIGHAGVYLPSASDPNRVANATIIVHPQWRRRQLGSALLRELQSRVRNSNVNRIRIYLDPQHHGAVTFMAKHGFRPSHEEAMYTKMRAEISDVPIRPFPHQGFTLRAFADINHLPTLVEAFNRGFEHLPGHRHTDEAEVSSWLPGFDTNGLLVLFTPENGIAGIVRAEHNQHRSEMNVIPTGVVDSPGLVKGYRSAEHYEVLLLAAVAYLDRLDLRWVELESWGESPTTLSHYESLGFRILRQQCAYEHVIHD